MNTVYLKIEGRVQGVGFRRWVVRKAYEIGGLSGWAKNLPNGDVEVFMQGENDAIRRLLQFCYQGPLFARVENLTFLDEASADHTLLEEGLFKRL